MGIPIPTAVEPRPLDASQIRITKAKTLKPIPAISNLAFGHSFSDHMLICKWSLNSGWEDPIIRPYGPLELDPACTVLHYAASLFEGMKVYKDSNGRARLFRPDMNIARMNRGAKRLGFPTVDLRVFLSLIKELLALDSRWIPDSPGCSLYLRPTMIGTRASLGVGPSDEIIFFVIASPVGGCFASGAKPISLLASQRDCRAWPGGTGSLKFSSNYANYYPQMNAVKDGYSQILWLFGEEEELTEGGMLNLFCVLQLEDGTTELVTPELKDMILPGVTRDSVLSLARSHCPDLPKRLQVSERQIFMKEIVERSQNGTLLEVFGTGTAAVVASISRIGYQGADIVIPCGVDGEMGDIAKMMVREIVCRQTGEIPSEWSVLAG